MEYLGIRSGCGTDSPLPLPPLNLFYALARRNAAQRGAGAGAERTFASSVVISAVEVRG